MSLSARGQPQRFQSTLPLRGATRRCWCDTCGRLISIHAPLTGSDVHFVVCGGHIFHFNPRSPYGERLAPCRTLWPCQYISIHAPLTGSDQAPRRQLLTSSISIHAPLTGSDRAGNASSPIGRNFNPRSPYGERHATIAAHTLTTGFQSTLPLRGATGASVRAVCKAVISIHAPLTGSDAVRVFLFRDIIISIHAPLTGSDPPASLLRSLRRNFNPRSPYGERLALQHRSVGVQAISIHAPLTGSDARQLVRVHRWGISIHAPLTGSDQALSPWTRPKPYFNPRSPYGERLDLLPLIRGFGKFQSTLPLRGATEVEGREVFGHWISIHAPLTGSDWKRAIWQMAIHPISIHAPLTGSDIRIAVARFFRVDFNPRSPYGERLLRICTRLPQNPFQSTLPLRGATCNFIVDNQMRVISIHAPLTGSD